MYEHVKDTRLKKVWIECQPTAHIPGYACPECMTEYRLPINPCAIECKKANQPGKEGGENV